MAKASFIPPEPQKHDVQLILTPDEAQFLRDLLGACVVGGGRRTLSDKILGALKALGVPLSQVVDYRGIVSFK